MLIDRIGFTPLKGGRHMPHDLADLTAGGPVGDRVFCLVDRTRGRVLRTVENPALLGACARWKAGVLSVDLEGRTMEGVPSASGEMLKVDYWGRPAAVPVCTGPWAQAYSKHLGHDVVLARCVVTRTPVNDPATERRKPCLCQGCAASARARRPFRSSGLTLIADERKSTAPPSLLVMVDTT